jgi:hypothetical protein
LASGLTGNEVPGNRLRVRIPCPPLVFQEKPALGFSRQPVLESPKTLQYDYPELIDATVGKVSRKAYEKYKDDPEAYVKARRSDARGKVFEATVAHEANERFKLIGRPDRVLTSAAEGDPAHSSDNLLWRDGIIRGRYQLKSTRNTKSIIDFLSEPEYVEKYANEVIVTHPDTFNKIRRELSKRKRLDDSLPPDWQRVDEAFQAGRVSDEIFPGWKVPTYYEAQQKADDVIRSQFERARREYGG